MAARWQYTQPVLIGLITVIIIFGVGAALADTQATDFEGFTLGSVNGQEGWSMTGSYDVEVVDTSSTYPAFGNRSLRISNAVTSGAFGDQTFSQALTDEAGEADAENGGQSGGTRQSYFEASWDFASAVPGSEQAGLAITVSPDRGDGARMSWIQIADAPTGLEVNFYGYDTSLGGTCGDLVNFVYTPVITGLNRAVPHTIKVTMEFVDGINNDVVRLYVDDNLVHTGKSWEDYFRNCEPTGGSRTVDSLLFRASGTAAPATLGNGFYIDNVSLFSGAVPCTTDCYVDATNGSDSNGGTSPADAKQTIQAAVDQVNPNGTVYVASGTYNEQVEISKNGITLQGAGPTETRLVSNVSCTNTMNSSATAGVRLVGDHSDITLQGFSVSGYDLGLDIGENIGRTITNVTVSQVTASNNCVHGILSQAGTTTGVSIDTVTANNNGSGFFAGRGVWFINGAKSNIRITNSTFNDNRLVGIDISDGDVTGVNIVGNTVTGNGDSGIGVLGPQGPGNNLVFGNTVTDNGRFGIEIKNSSGTTGVISNSISLTGPGSDTRDYAGIAVYRRSPGATNADQPSGVTVISNTVTGFVEPNGDGEGFGIVVEGTGVTVAQNDVSGNDVGIQIQEGNPSPNTNGTDYFDRGDASVIAEVTVNQNNITGNSVGLRTAGTTNTTDGTLNWWGFDSGPGGEGAGTGDSVSANVTYCPWLDGAYPTGSSVIPSLFSTCGVDVSIRKTVEPADPMPGQTITFTLTYSNTGAELASNVRIADAIPAQVITPAMERSSGATITLVIGQTFTWTVDDSLATNAGGIITLTGQIDSNVSAGSFITNTATITATGDVTPDNNEDIVTIQVTEPANQEPAKQKVYLPVISKDPEATP